MIRDNVLSITRSNIISMNRLGFVEQLSLRAHHSECHSSVANFFLEDKRFSRPYCKWALVGALGHPLLISHSFYLGGAPLREEEKEEEEEEEEEEEDEEEELIYTIYRLFQTKMAKIHSHFQINTALRSMTSERLLRVRIHEVICNYSKWRRKDCRPRSSS